MIDVWGADHQGHVSRVKTAVQALGVDPARLEILIYQLVSFRRGDELVRLSKRAGNIVLMREVVDEVGRGRRRFFFLSRSADSQMEFDLELAKRQSAENPVYYVQYAHARIAGILANAAERGISSDGADVSLLTHPAELALVRKMLQLPELVELIAERSEPHHLPHYAQELATAFHEFYRVPRARRRSASAVEGAAAALRGGAGRARAEPDADGHEHAGEDVTHGASQQTGRIAVQLLCIGAVCAARPLVGRVLRRR